MGKRRYMGARTKGAKRASMRRPWWAQRAWGSVLGAFLQAGSEEE
jgi:hypothetical protein